MKTRRSLTEEKEKKRIGGRSVRELEAKNSASRLTKWGPA